MRSLKFIIQTFRFRYGAYWKFENSVYPNALPLRSTIPPIEYHRDPLFAMEREIGNCSKSGNKHLHSLPDKFFQFPRNAH